MTDKPTLARVKAIQADKASQEAQEAARVVLAFALLVILACVVLVDPAGFAALLYEHAHP